MTLVGLAVGQKLSGTEAPLEFWQYTVRCAVPAPQRGLQAPKAPTNQLQPLLRKQVCEVAGLGVGQYESGATEPSGRRQKTVRVCVPEPQVVEQAP